MVSKHLDAVQSFGCSVRAKTVSKRSDSMETAAYTVATEVVSMHPDAMRRRQEAAARLVHMRKIEWSGWAAGFVGNAARGLDAMEDLGLRLCRDRNGDGMRL